MEVVAGIDAEPSVREMGEWETMNLFAVLEIGCSGKQ